MIAVLEEDWGVSDSYYGEDIEDIDEDKEKDKIDKDHRSWWDKFWEN